MKQEQLGKDQGILKMYFRPFLRWFDRNLETLFIDGGRQVRYTWSCAELSIIFNIW